MKRLTIFAFALALFMCLGRVYAAETNDAAAELNGLVGKVNSKVQAGKKSETDLADELKEFDGLLAKHKEEKTDAVAQILFMKAKLYVEVIHNLDKGAEALEQLKRDFPETKQGRRADELLDSLKTQEASTKGESGPVAAGPVIADLNGLIGRINDKLRTGKKTEADLAGELQEFDALLAKHKDEKTDEVAQILFMKAQLYLQAIEEPGKAADFFKQLKRDFPETKQGRTVDERFLSSLAKQEEASRLQAALAEGMRFPDFDEQDAAGKPLSIGAYKGKVVLIDFWATWCPPCRMELPNVRKAYEKYHGRGFEIIGISLDDDKEKLTSFTHDNKMPWPQYFDGKGWGNKLANKYGVTGIPATFLLDGEGKIIGKNFRGDALEQALAKALSKS